MRKWEYGFLKISHKLEIRGIGGRKSHDYITAYFKNAAIASYDYSFDLNQQKDDSTIYDIAFNELGRMGWELATYVVSYSSGVGDTVSRKHERICFKRLID